MSVNARELVLHGRSGNATVHGASSVIESQPNSKRRNRLETKMAPKHWMSLD